MKKTLSVILAVCICLCSLFSSAMIASATTTIDGNTVDLSKSTVVGGEEKVQLTPSGTGFTATFSNYASRLTSGKLWLKKYAVTLRDSNDVCIFLYSGVNYIIDVEYSVDKATSGGNWIPQIGLVYNDSDSASNAIGGDNGEYVIAANTHTTTGNFKLNSGVFAGNDRSLRLAFSGQGQITVKSVTITTNASVSEADLTKAEMVSVSGPGYTDFSAKTSDEPLKFTMNDDSSWFPFQEQWTTTVKTGKQWLKAILTLKDSDDSYYTMKADCNYRVIVAYKYTTYKSGVTDKDDGCKPAVCAVYGDQANVTADTGSHIVSVMRISGVSGNLNSQLLYKSSVIDGSGKAGLPLRVAFGGRGCTFNVLSVKVIEMPKTKTVSAVTFVDGENKTSEFYANGSTLPTLADTEDEVFAGWIDANGNKVETVSGDVTVTPVFLSDSKVDFSKSEVIVGNGEGLKGNLVITTPTDAEGTLGATVGGYNKILFNGDTVKESTWSKGLSVALKYESGNYVTLKAGKKYAINVEYDVTSASSYDYPAQIALSYNNSNQQGNMMADNGTMVIAAAKHRSTGSYTLSAVATGLNGNPLRFTFDGQGEFIIKSISIEEAASGSTTDYAVKFVDKNGNINTAQLVNPTDTLPVIDNNLTENFAGWYNGDTKVTSVSADGTLTAKWTDKDDSNMDNAIDVLDYITVKLALELGKTDSFYDLNRDGVFDEKDIDYMLRVNLDVAEITFGENNIKDYVICNEMDSSLIANKALTALNAFFNEKTGGELPVVASTDADKVITLKVDTALATDAYAITLSDGKLTVAGGSDYAVNAAVNSLIKRFEATETLAADYSEEGNCEAMLDGYKLAWGDEFDGTALDTAKWTVSTETQNGPFYTADSDYYKATSGAATWTQNGSYKQDGVVNYVDDDYTVSDGVLTMNTRKTDAGYSATKISSNKQFRYGLMEAKIKFGAGEGATYTFWSRSVDGAEKETSVVNEFDFVENFGTKDIRGNLHTWKKWGDEHINHGSNIDTRETVENAVDGEYHYIAMEWTDSVVKFYFDGELYLEQDITDEATWEAFRNSTYLILGIAVPTGSYAIDSNGTTPAEVLGDISSFSDSMSVDYVRIFQN